MFFPVILTGTIVHHMGNLPVLVLFGVCIVLCAGVDLTSHTADDLLQGSRVADLKEAGGCKFFLLTASSTLVVSVIIDNDKVYISTWSSLEFSVILDRVIL